VTAEEPLTSAATAVTPNSTAGMTTKVVKGSLWTLAGQVAPIAVSLVTTPFVIRMLGAEGYGVYVLAGLIPAYLLFADLGMGMASTKFGSEAFGKGDPSEEARVVRTAALITLAGALPLAAAIFLFSNELAAALNIPGPLLGQASIAFKFASITFLFFVLNTVVNTPQLARLRMDLNTLVNAGTRIAGLLAAPFVIYLGWGVAGAVLALTVSTVVAFVGHAAVSGRLNPRLFELSIDRRLVRPMLKFGGVLALSSIAGVLLAQLEKLVLTKQTSVEQLAYYSVAFTFAGAAALFGQAMSQSIVPAYSQLLAPEKRSQLVGLFSLAVRVSIFGLPPLLVTLFVIARPFFTIWAGPDFGRESTLPFYILLCGLLFNLNAYVPSGLILASGRSDLVAKLYWIELVPYIALMFFLTGRYGAVGAAAAWSIRVVVDALIFFWLVRRIYDVRVGIGRQWSRWFVSVIILLPPVFLTAFYPGMSLWIAGTLLLIALSLNAILLWKAVLTEEEKYWLKGRASRFQVQG
jgi:O-antigen/teichoic acid export membrane protein